MSRDDSELVATLIPRKTNYMDRPGAKKEKEKEKEKENEIIPSKAFATTP